MAAADGLRLLLLSALAAMATAAAGPRVNMLTYFDLAVDRQPVGRIVMGLFKSTPKTSENFRRLCTGEAGFGYKGSRFNKVWQYAGLLGGIIDGERNRSAYENGTAFRAEGQRIKHSAPYMVTMDTNPMLEPSQLRDTEAKFVGSMFMITTAPCPHLDLDNTVFGTVIEGIHVLDKLKMYGLPPRPGDENDVGGDPSREITIMDAGQLPLARPFSSKLGFEVPWQAIRRHQKNFEKIEPKGEEIVQEAKKKDMIFGLGGPAPAGKQDGTASKKAKPEKPTTEALQDPALRAALEHEQEDSDEEDDGRFRGRDPPPAPPPKKVVGPPGRTASAAKKPEPSDEDEDEDDRRDRARASRGRAPGRVPGRSPSSGQKYEEL